MATNVAPSTIICCQAALRVGSTNWGKNARKKSAVFGLSALTNTPCKKTRERRLGSSATGTSSSSRARKSPNVDASGTDNPLCRLRLPAHLRGEAGDHVQEQVGQPRDEEREEQAVVVEALYKGRILEDASEFRGRGGLQEAWKDRDHTDKHRSYGPP